MKHLTTIVTFISINNGNKCALMFKLDQNQTLVTTSYSTRVKMTNEEVKMTNEEAKMEGKKT